MGFQIDDGKGGGKSAEVDGNNRLNVRSVESTSAQSATDDEDSYNINSGLVTITTTDEQGVLYLKNNETRDFKITAFVVILGPSTGGSATDTTRVRVYKNPTTGTLISEANAADTNSNRNFSSSKTFTADVYKGDGSSTVTDGTVHIESLVTPGIVTGKQECL